jgi:hypothetical protein
LLHAVDHNGPFYPQELYTLLDQLLRVTQRERDDVFVSADDHFQLAWFKRGSNDSGEYFALVERVDNAIRDWLSKLAVHGLDR